MNSPNKTQRNVSGGPLISSRRHSCALTLHCEPVQVGQLQVSLAKLLFTISHGARLALSIACPEAEGTYSYVLSYTKVLSLHLVTFYQLVLVTIAIV